MSSWLLMVIDSAVCASWVIEFPDTDSVELRLWLCLEHSFTVKLFTLLSTTSWSVITFGCFAKACICTLCSWLPSFPKRRWSSGSTALVGEYPSSWQSFMPPSEEPVRLTLSCKCNLLSLRCCNVYPSLMNALINWYTFSLFHVLSLQLLDRRQ